MTIKCDEHTRRLAERFREFLEMLKRRREREERKQQKGGR